MKPLSLLCVLNYAVTAMTQGPADFGPARVLQDQHAELERAVRQGNAEHTKALLAGEGVNPAFGCNHAIRIAASSGHAECLGLLLADPRVDPTAYDNETIRSAAKYGHPECVSLLLADPRVNPAARDNDAILRAAEYGRTECVELLLADPRVNPADRDNHAIFWAAHNGHVGCLKLLLADKRVDPADCVNSTIRIAAQHGHSECVQLLLADPRVDPGAVPLDICHPSVRSLVEWVVELKKAGLGDFELMKLTIMPDAVLAILISRNRSRSQTWRHLIYAYLPRLAVPDEADRALETLVMLVMPGEPWWTDGIRAIIKAFIRRSTTKGPLSGWAAVTATYC